MMDLLLLLQEPLWLWKFLFEVLALPRVLQLFVQVQVVLLVPLVNEGAQGIRRLEQDVPTVPTVTPVRATPGDVLFAAEAHAPAPPVPRPHVDARKVNEHGGPLVPVQLTSPHVVLGRQRSGAYKPRTPPAASSLGPRDARHLARHPPIV